LGQNGGIATNGVIYNNIFDGDSGVNITAHIYLQDSIRMSPFQQCVLVPANRTINSLWFSGITQAECCQGPQPEIRLQQFIRTGGHVRGAASTQWRKTTLR